jgi:hypothetical protein
MTQDDLPGDATPEVVAYRLMLRILEIEGRPLGGDGAPGMPKTTRNVVLDSYADCIEAVRGNRPKRSPRLSVAGTAPGA